MTLFKICIASAALGLSLAGAGAGVASADAQVVVETPLFYPHADFRYDDGYYTTHDGHYYHYDKDRDGWHVGRNHREGVRFETRRARGRR